MTTPSDKDSIVFLCYGSGEGSQEFKVVADEMAVMEWAESVFGSFTGEHLADALAHFRDQDNWSNDGCAYECKLYCATMNVWKVYPSELALPGIVRPELQQRCPHGYLKKYCGPCSTSPTYVPFTEREIEMIRACLDDGTYTKQEQKDIGKLCDMATSALLFAQESTEQRNLAGSLLTERDELARENEVLREQNFAMNATIARSASGSNVERELWEALDGVVAWENAERPSAQHKAVWDRARNALKNTAVRSTRPLLPMTRSWIDLFAKWEDSNGALAAIMPQEFEALMFDIITLAVHTSPRMARNELDAAGFVSATQERSRG